MLGGWLGMEFGSLPVWTVLSVHSSIFPNCFLLSPFFLVAIFLSVLLLPSSLASARPFFPFHSGGYSENTMQAQLCQAHTPYHGTAPLPAQGKPTPNSLSSPWKGCWPIRGLCPVPTPLLSPVWFSMPRELLEGKTVGYPWLVVRIVWESWDSLVFPQPSVCTPPPTPGPPAVCQLHPRAQAAMTVTVWSCPDQRKGPRRTVALGAWVHGPRLPTVVQSGPSPLVVQAYDDRPSRTGSADRAVTALRGRRVTSQMWAPELLSQRLKDPLMSHALDLLWLAP